MSVIDTGPVVILCGPEMREHSRTSEGVKWCFRHRGRAEFWRVLMVEVEPSYWGPILSIKCGECDATDGDLFPGWTREWDDE